MLSYTTIVFLYVDHVQDIEWNNNAFEQLVLPHDYKQIVWAFVEGQISNSDDFDDLVKGKGNGFIYRISLHRISRYAYLNFCLQEKDLSCS